MRLPTLFLASLSLATAHAATIHVSPKGSDANPGTAAEPVASLARARDLARTQRTKMPAEPITIQLAGGEYHLAEPLILTPEDSGTKEAPLIWRSTPDERAMLRAVREITGWKPWRNGILVADLKAQGLDGVRFHQLFRKADDAEFSTRLPLARYPNANPKQPLYGGFLYVAETAKNSREELHYHDGELPLSDWPDTSQAEIVTIYNRGWMYANTPIRQIDPETRTVRFEKIRGQMIRLNRYYIQNVLGALDAPGEWYLDYQTSQLYLKPPTGGIGRVFAPVADQIVELQGQLPYPHRYLNTSWTRPKEECPLPDDAPPERPVSFVSFAGIDFEGARQDALRFLGTRNCDVVGCRIANVGNVGVNLGAVTSSFPEVGNPRVTPATGTPIGAGGGGQILLARDPGIDCRIVGCDIWSVGSEGVMLMGDRNLAENNHIYDTGLFAKDAPCINLLGDGNIARRNTLHDCPRCTVFLKGVNNVVEGNDSHHANMETTDMGVIRMVQRNAHLKGNVIRYNRVADSVGYGFVWNQATHYESPFYTWGIYLDDYTCGTTVHGNVVTRCGRGGIMIHGGGDNTVTNNVCVDAGLYQIELAPISRDYRDVKSVFAGNRIERNILVCHAEDSVPYRYTSATPDTAAFASNLVDFGTRDPLVVIHRQNAIKGWDEWLALGQDKGSIVAPAGIKLTTDDVLEMSPKSPAWKLDFSPIPTTAIGCYESRARASWPIAPNRDRDREKPILATIPGFQVPPKQPVQYEFAGPVRLDFEDLLIGGRCPRGDVLAPHPSAIEISDEQAASGTRSLKFIDAPDLKFDWQPRIYFPFSYVSGKVELSFDLYLPADSPATLYIDPRQYKVKPEVKSGYISGPMLTVQPDGALAAGGQTLATLPRDTWCHLELILDLGQPTAASPLRLRCGDAPVQELSVPHVSSDFQFLERVVIASLAKQTTTFYIDNLTIAPVK
jgi:parallel beta-helix repeat protein